MDILELAFSYRFRISMVSLVRAGLHGMSTSPNSHLCLADLIFIYDEQLFRILYVLMFGKFWPSIRILSPVHMAGQETQVFSSAVFWLGCLIIPFVTILRDVAYKV